MIVSGGKVLDQCHYCGKWCNLSGFFKGVHICIAPEARAFMDKHSQLLRNRQMQVIDSEATATLRKLLAAPTPSPQQPKPLEEK